MGDTVERFSDRVANYVKYRPDYPRQIIDLLAEQCSLTPGSIVADVGCGTGISTRMFLENGNRVFGVEPNDAMRAAAVEYLAEFPRFTPVNGTSDATTLDDGSVDLVVAAQAFHWFDPETTRPEFARILRPNGAVALIWNERQLDTTPFLIEYERFLLKYARDYSSVRHENISADKIGAFFRHGFESVTFPNVQELDLVGLTGRMLSSSYMPSEDDPVFSEMARELESIFAKHHENGRIKVFYDTNVYFSRI
ncbi:MAG: class I SAM-dependent methyltransferase [Pyrinomonadaceae bacterium]